MSYMTQNMNQFTQSPILGAVDLTPNPDVVTVQINPSSSATYMQVGSPFKIITGTSGAILVDAQTGPTDATVFGVVGYNDRKNKYAAGDMLTIIVSGYMYMLTSAAVVRGTSVSITASTSSADPTVATDTTSGHFCVGYAIDEASAAGQLIRVQIKPFTHA